jgi:hypothetical protein
MVMDPIGLIERLQTAGKSCCGSLRRDWQKTVQDA